LIFSTKSGEMIISPQCDIVKSDRETAIKRDSDKFHA
jgi:hypothetical protein